MLKRCVLKVSLERPYWDPLWTPSVRFFWVGGAVYDYFLEDWPGEATLIESEMKRFRKWADERRQEMYRLLFGFGPGPEIWLTVKDGAYRIAHHSNIRGGFVDGRIVYSPEEGT